MVPPPLPVRPLGPVNLVREAAELLERMSADAIADPGVPADSLVGQKARTLWPAMAADLRAILQAYESAETALSAGAGVGVN